MKLKIKFFWQFFFFWNHSTLLLVWSAWSLSQALLQPGYINAPLWLIPRYIHYTVGAYQYYYGEGGGQDSLFFLKKVIDFLQYHLGKSFDFYLD